MAVIAMMLGGRVSSRRSLSLLSRADMVAPARSSSLPSSARSRVQPQHKAARHIVSFTNAGESEPSYEIGGLGMTRAVVQTLAYCGLLFTGAFYLPSYLSPAASGADADVDARREKQGARDDGQRPAWYRPTEPDADTLNAMHWEDSKRTLLGSIVGLNIVIYGLHAVQPRFLERPLARWGTTSLFALARPVRRSASARASRDREPRLAAGFFTLFTSGFSHKQLWHLGFNMIAFYSIADGVCDEVRRRFQWHPASDARSVGAAAGARVGDWWSLPTANAATQKQPDAKTIAVRRGEQDSRAALALVAAFYVSALGVAGLCQVGFGFLEICGACLVGNTAGAEYAVATQSLGASGGVYGLLFALAMLQRTPTPTPPTPAFASTGVLQGASVQLQHAIDHFSSTVYGTANPPSAGSISRLYAERAPMQLSFIFLPWYPIALETACLGLVGVDLLGLVAGSSMFGHAAHLGGALFGAGLFYNTRLPWSSRGRPQHPPQQQEEGDGTATAKRGDFATAWVAALRARQQRIGSA